MKSKIAIILMIGLVLMVGRQVFAVEAGFKAPGEELRNLKAPDGRLLTEAELAKAMKKDLDEGISPIAIVKAAIDDGYQVAEVFKAALSDGVSLDSVIRGGIAAGVTTAVISKSAISAGESTQQVTLAMGRTDTGLAYTPVGGEGGAPGAPPVNPTFGSTTNNPNVISPSRP